LPLARFKAVEELVAESNRIEGIHRPPTVAELAEFERFMSLESVSIADLQKFVSIYQPGAVLRQFPGLDVRVGDHVPPPGGPAIIYELDSLLCKSRCESAWRIHTLYENLHPFTDGNGRSVRVLWYWMMRGDYRAQQYGFLHLFYYQTLANTSKEVVRE